MKKYTLEAMEVHSGLVRIIGEQHHSWYPDEDNFHWTLSIDECDYIEIEIILSIVNDKVMLEIYEVENEKQASKTIDYDVIYTLIGYACTKQIELKHSEYLYIEGKKL